MYFICSMCSVYKLSYLYAWLGWKIVLIELCMLFCVKNCITEKKMLLTEDNSMFKSLFKLCIVY